MSSRRQGPPPGRDRVGPTESKGPLGDAPRWRNVPRAACPDGLTNASGCVEVCYLVLRRRLPSRSPYRASSHLRSLIRRDFLTRFARHFCQAVYSYFVADLLAVLPRGFLNYPAVHLVPLFICLARVPLTSGH